MKSKGRKDSDFGQLVNYIFQLDGQEAEHDYPAYLHNMPSAVATEPESIVKAFSENDAYRKVRKGGVGMYHEILSFAPEDRERLMKNVGMLYDMAAEYIQLRAPNALAMAKAHFDKAHAHIHVMISANERGTSKSVRLSKAEFQEKRRAIETYQLRRYPQLTRSYVHTRDRDRFRHQEEREHVRSTVARRMDDRGGAMTQKESAGQELVTAFSSVNSYTDLQRVLSEGSWRTFERSGVLNGIYVGERKYRFTTLLKEFGEIKERVTQLLKEERTQVRQRELVARRQAQLLKASGRGKEQNRERDFL